MNRRFVMSVMVTVLPLSGEKIEPFLSIVINKFFVSFDIFSYKIFVFKKCIMKLCISIDIFFEKKSVSHDFSIKKTLHINKI